MVRTVLRKMGTWVAAHLSAERLLLIRMDLEWFLVLSFSRCIYFRGGKWPSARCALQLVSVELGLPSGVESGDYSYNVWKCLRFQEL